MAHHTVVVMCAPRRVVWCCTIPGSEPERVLGGRGYVRGCAVEPGERRLHMPTRATPGV